MQGGGTEVFSQVFPETGEPPTKCEDGLEAKDPLRRDDVGLPCFSQGDTFFLTSERFF